MSLEYLKLVLPGSLFFFILVSIVSTLLIFSKVFKGAGKFILLLNFFFYFLFSIPIFSDLISRPLVLYKNDLEFSYQNKKIQAIVLLDGGTERYSVGSSIIYERPNKIALLRSLEAIRIYRELGTRPLIVVSGGDDQIASRYEPDGSAIKRLLIQNGIPASDIFLDSQSLNTRAHATTMAILFKERHIQDFVLVSSPTHLRRATKAFNQVGLLPIAIPSINSIDTIEGWKRYMPTFKSLEFLEEVMHDYFGLVYYYIKGWI